MKRIAYRFFLIVLLSVLAVEVFPVSAQVTRGSMKGITMKNGLTRISITM